MSQTLVRLEPVDIDSYVREVLPDTFDLWGDDRTFEKYARDFRDVASSTYARRRTFTIGIREDDRVVCSCKNYEREIRAGDIVLRATGIGAVFTPEIERGRGLASLMIGALLDTERAAGRDLAFLYSDIHPAFYERLGFSTLPSRLFTLRASALDGSRSGATPLEQKDWQGVRRCFETLDSQQTWAFRRTPLIWNWMRNRWAAPPRRGAQNVQLVIRGRRSVIAYVIGRRVLQEDAFVVDDFAFDGDDGRALIGPLLRSAAGDLRRITGWVPPAIARESLPAGSVRKRKGAIFMLVPLSPIARAWWAEQKSAVAAARHDWTWNADHI